MATLQGWRVFGNSFHRIFARSSGNLASAPNVNQPHIYSRRFTEEQLTKYIIDNVVYSDSRCIVSRVPQGVNFSCDGFWTDFEGEKICDKSLQEILPNLFTPFNSSELFITKHPRRYCQQLMPGVFARMKNASGLLLFAKSFRSFHYLRSCLINATNNLVKLFTYLVVVIGNPSKVYNDTFKIDHRNHLGGSYTQILDESYKGSTKMVKAKYTHEVKDSKEKFSLVEINVSYDARDSVRHIVAQKFFTPVLGDAWNIKRATHFLFGVPLISDPKIKPAGLYALDKETLEKLQLTSEQENIIPIHAHLYNLSLPVQKNSVLFASVPPPDYFVWTCQQLGLHKIEEYITPEVWERKKV